jgi:DNA-binding transcriptional LysR family regulator
VLDAVARHGSVTKAARDLSLSQPAVSHALSRLRDLTGDRLFLRIGRRLVPTRRAETMAIEVRAVMEASERLFLTQSFDPSVSDRHFRIGASDYSLLTVIPGLLRCLGAVAPSVRLTLQPVGPETLADLARNVLDASFWVGAPPNESWRVTPLFDESLVGLCARKHPLLRKRRVTLDDWLRHPHAVVSLGDPSSNPVERELGRLRRLRHVALVSHSFAGAMAAVAEGGMVMAIPSRLPVLQRNLVRFALPLQLPSYRYGIIRHVRSTGDEGVEWLRAIIAETAASLPKVRPKRGGHVGRLTPQVGGHKTNSK